MIEIYTDGASRGNPGPGGYGIVMRYGSHEKEISEGFRLTTNNRMELLSVIVALKAITRREIPVTVFTDSKYVVEAIEKGWVFNWQKKGFKSKKNEDLWREYLKLHPHFKIRYKWIKGHAGHPENERCDALAVAAALGSNLKVDEGYESQSDGGMFD